MVTFLRSCNDSAAAGWCRTFKMWEKWLKFNGIKWVLLISVRDTHWGTWQAGKWPDWTGMCKVPAIISNFHIHVSKPNCPADLSVSESEVHNQPFHISYMNYVYILSHHPPWIFHPRNIKSTLGVSHLSAAVVTFTESRSHRWLWSSIQVHQLNS